LTDVDHRQDHTRARARGHGECSTARHAACRVADSLVHISGRHDLLDLAKGVTRMDDTKVPPATPATCDPRSEADGLPAQQKERYLAETCRCFDVPEEIDSLRGDIGWLRDGHSARTLVKHDDLRVVLIALAQGARIAEHTADARASILAVAGSVRVWIGPRAVVLRLGGLLVLDRGVRHAVEALEESAVLLTLAWPVTRPSRP
jgi:quercetin dioxygenase-like cupin family protein